MAVPPQLLSQSKHNTLTTHTLQHTNHRLLGTGLNLDDMPRASESPLQIVIDNKAAPAAQITTAASNKAAGAISASQITGGQITAPSKARGVTAGAEARQIALDHAASASEMIAAPGKGEVSAGGAPFEIIVSNRA